MGKRRSGGGQQRNVENAAVAHVCPAPLVELPTARHLQVFAAFAGALPADQRDLPPVRALCAAAAGHVIALGELQRAIDSSGAVVDGNPSKLINAMATMNSALIANLRALRILPTTDRRTLANVARYEREARGHRDLTAVMPRGPNGEIDWIAVEAAERAARGKPQ